MPFPRFVLANGQAGYAIHTAVKSLKDHLEGLDVIERTLREVEDDPEVKYVSYGAMPNILGEMELDASVMRGDTLQTGSIGALKGYRHPITVARAVLERTPHEIIVGEGAALLAAEIGEPLEETFEPDAKKQYAQWIEEQLKPRGIDTSSEAWKQGALAPLLLPLDDGNRSKGTGTLLVHDGSNGIFGGVSTSGWGCKYPGRLGDSPIIGAGLYVDNRYGAVACTHTGEMTIRCGTARTVILYMKKGASVQEACHEAMGDLMGLREGYLGSVVIHAVNAEGEPFVISTDAREVPYWFWNEDMSDPEKRIASKVS